MQRNGVKVLKRDLLQQSIEEPIQEVFKPAGMSSSPIFCLGNDIQVANSIIQPTFAGIFTEISKDGSCYIGTRAEYIQTALEKVISEIPN